MHALQYYVQDGFVEGTQTPHYAIRDITTMASEISAAIADGETEFEMYGESGSYSFRFPYRDEPYEGYMAHFLNTAFSQAGSEPTQYFTNNISPNHPVGQAIISRLTEAEQEIFALPENYTIPSIPAHHSQQSESFEYRQVLDQRARDDFEARTQSNLAAIQAEIKYNAEMQAAREKQNAERDAARTEADAARNAAIIATLSDQSKALIAALEEAKKTRLEIENADITKQIAAERDKAQAKLAEILDPKLEAARRKREEEAARAKIAEALDSIREASKRGPLTEQQIEDLKNTELGKYDQAIKDWRDAQDAEPEAEAPRTIDELAALFGAPFEMSEKTLAELAANAKAAKIWTREELAAQRKSALEFVASGPNDAVSFVQRILRGES